MLVAYDELCKRLQLFGSGNLIGIEGFCSSGKSALANRLGDDVPATVIHTDDFCTPRDNPPPYADGLNIPALKGALEQKTIDQCCIIEGICLRDILAKCAVSADFYVYIKKRSSIGLWHDGLHLENYEDNPSASSGIPEPHASDLSYHSVHRPHEHADWTILRIED